MMDKEGYKKLIANRKVVHLEQPGEYVVGTYAGTDLIRKDDHEVECLILRQENGDEVLMPVSTCLRGIAGRLIPDTVILIEYMGDVQTPKGRQMKMYEVYERSM